MASSAKLIGKRIGTVTKELLKQVYDSGLTIQEIATQLKCSAGSVSLKLAAAGTEMRTSSDYKAPAKKTVDIRTCDRRDPDLRKFSRRR